MYVNFILYTQEYRDIAQNDPKRHEPSKNFVPVTSLFCCCRCSCEYWDSFARIKSHLRQARSHPQNSCLPPCYMNQFIETMEFFIICRPHGFLFILQWHVRHRPALFNQYSNPTNLCREVNRMVGQDPQLQRYLATYYLPSMCYVTLLCRMHRFEVHLGNEKRNRKRPMRLGAVRVRVKPTDCSCAVRS
jgi:hypothetical protein